MYEAKNYEHLLGISGFSDELLKNHFKLYEGYVANVNKFGELSESVETGTPQYAELKRRFGWEWNGMRLHELYFGNITKDAKPIDENSMINHTITGKFGSFENWEKDFRATGAMRGIGWVMLVYDKNEDRLFNVWIDEHDTGHLAGLTPLLVMDVFEHAFITDYGLARADYVNAFMGAVDWEEVDRRLT